LKILLIHQYFLEQNDPGGSRFNEMTKVWVREGHEVTVLCGMLNYVTGKIPEKYNRKFVAESEYEPRLKVIRSYVSSNYNTSFLGRLWAYFSFVFSSIWAGVFKVKGKHDVILVTSPPLFVGITAYILAKIKRLPFVFEVRDLWPESAIDTGVITNKWIIKFAYSFEAFIYRRAHLINVLTPAFRDQLIEKKNVVEEKIIFIPNAADFSLSDQLLSNFDEHQFRKDNGLAGKFVVTYVGAHGVANHLDQLLDAAEFIDDHDIVIQLIGDGMEKNKLINDANNRGLKNIKFVNSVPKSEVFKYILASDMGASVLKKVDTFKTIYSNKTFDYMACKKPVLLAIDGVSRELVEKADCGVFVEPENGKVISEAILNAKNNRELYLKKGENGYNYAKQNFDRKVLANHYLEHLKNISRNV